MVYIHSPGDTIRSSETNSNLNGIYKIDSEKAINDVSATNSGELAVSSQVLIDKFLDSNGQNNTVDIGNSTTLFQSVIKSHQCHKPVVIINEFTTTNATAWVGKATSPNYRQDLAQKITLSNSKKIISVWLNINSYYSTLEYPVTIRIETNSSNNPSGTLAHANATKALSLSAKPTGWVEWQFDSSFTLTAGDYWIVVDSVEINVRLVNLKIDTANGFNGQNRRRENNGSWLTGSGDLNFKLYGDTTVDSTIQSVATPIPTGMTKVFVALLMYEELETGDSVTADVSIDGGSTYTTGIAVNTWTDITSTTGTSLIVKANLHTNDGLTTPKILGWRCLLE